MENNELQDGMYDWTGRLADKEMLEGLLSTFRRFALPSEEFYRKNFSGFRIDDGLKHRNCFRVNINPLRAEYGVRYFREDLGDKDIRHKIGIGGLHYLLYLENLDELREIHFGMMEKEDAEKYVEALMRASRLLELKWFEYSEKKAGQQYFELELEKNGKS